MAEPNANTDKLGWRDAAIGAGILALALLTRLHFLIASSDSAWPHSAWFEGDAPLWANWAKAIISGHQFEHGLALHTPGAAYALCFILDGRAGGNLVVAKVMWCVASALGCALTFVAARAELPRRAAAIGAVFLTFSFSSYLLATSLNGEGLYSLLLPLVVIGSLGLIRRPSWLGAGALGAVNGAAMLIRPEHLLLAFALMGWILWKRRGDVLAMGRCIRTAGQVALAIIAAIAVCLPWSITTARATARFNTDAPAIQYERLQPPWTADARAAIESLPAFARANNVEYLGALASQQHLAQVTGDVVRSYFRQFGSTPEPIAMWHLVSGQGPLSFAMANHPSATGGFSKAALDQRFGADLKFSLPTHVYLYNHGYEAGIGWIREDPGRWARLAARKIGIFFEGAFQGVTARNLPAGREGQRRAVDIFTARPFVLWWGLILSALFGLGLGIARRRGTGVLWFLIIAYKVAITVVFFGYARQAASILPAFAFFAALGVDSLLRLAALGLSQRARDVVRRGAPALWLLAIGALLGADLSLSRAEAIPDPASPVTPAPRWGVGAWESAVDVKLYPNLEQRGSSAGRIP